MHSAFDEKYCDFVGVRSKVEQEPKRRSILTLSDMVNPEEYASSNEVQKRNIKILINKFDKDLIKISGKCMDVGCGPGNITNNILLPALDPNAVMIGTDISLAMIEYAKKTYDNNERLGFEILDIQTTNFPEKYISKFDAIFSFYALHWCNDIRKAFENMYCMLQPGGTIFVCFPEAHDALNDFFKIMAQDTRFASYIPNTNKSDTSALSGEDLKNLLQSIGFRVHHSSLRKTDFSDISTYTFLSSVIASSTFLDAMPPDTKEELKEYACDIYNKNVNVELHDNQQCDNKEETIIFDKCKRILIAYAQKDVQ